MGTKTGGNIDITVDDGVEDNSKKRENSKTITMKETSEELSKEETSEELSKEETSEELSKEETSEENKEEKTANNIEDLKSENKVLRNKYLRQLAEVENFKKRQRTIMDDFRKYAIENLITELLPIVDNMERALDHKYTTLEESRNIIDGIVMIKDQFLEILKKHGLETIDSCGQKFNPELHEAVQVEDTDEYEDGTVIEQIQKGYKLYKKILRNAKVKVSRKLSEEESATNGED